MGIYTKVIGKEIKNMVVDTNCLIIQMYIKVNIKKENSKDSEFIFGKIRINTRETGSKD